jgi:hypothetical protein
VEVLLFYAFVFGLILIIALSLLGNEPMTEQKVWQLYNQGRIDLLEAKHLISTIKKGSAK